MISDTSCDNHLVFYLVNGLNINVFLIVEVIRSLTSVYRCLRIEVIK